MKRIRMLGWAGLTLCAGLMACTPRAPEAPLDMARVKADLQVVAQARVLFAHQSVGRNLLEGVQGLAREADVPLRIQRLEAAAPSDDGPGLYHLAIGINGEPRGKVQAFAGVLESSPRPYDVALLKFCYEDLAQGAQGRTGLLEHYAASVGALQSAHPQLRIVHVTTPLRADPPGWKTRLKRLLGRDTEEDADNIARNAYNAGLVARFKGATVFDLARVESTHADGTRSSFVHQGAPVYTLAGDYSADGGHLNAQGRRVAAAEFLHTLALALQRKPGA